MQLLKLQKQLQSDSDGKYVKTNHHMRCIQFSYITVTSAQPKFTLFKNLFDQQIASETVAKVELYSRL